MRSVAFGIGLLSIESVTTSGGLQRGFEPRLCDLGGGPEIRFQIGLVDSIFNLIVTGQIIFIGLDKLTS